MTADAAGDTTWRTLRAEAVERLRAPSGDLADVDARRIVEQASGAEPGQLALVLDDTPTTRSAAYFDSMLARRCAGEPLQYVLGRWGFRSLDLAVDRRVLIPRPETEVVAGLALAELERVGVAKRTPRAADLGTGSGCIGLSLVVEHPTVTVVCTDDDPAAVAAARANTAGLGRPATRVEVRRGDWFDAFGPHERGGFDVIVSNPPYVADDEELPALVADWEPTAALFGGPTGLEQAEHLIAGAPDWLASGGALVLELGATQLDAATVLARARGFHEVEVHPDLAGRDRALVARVR